MGAIYPVSEKKWAEIISFYKKGGSVNECKIVYRISSTMIKNKLIELGIYRNKCRTGRLAFIK